MYNTVHNWEILVVAILMYNNKTQHQIKLSLSIAIGYTLIGNRISL